MNSSVKTKCMDSYCKKFLQLGVQNLTKFINKSDGFIKETNQKLTSTNITKEEKRKLLLIKKFHKTFRTVLTKKIKSKKWRNNNLRICEEAYCNPNCKDTIFEKGTKISQKTIKNYVKNIQSYSTKKVTDNKEIINELKTRKQRIFEKNDDVLINDFFKDIKPKDVKKMKKVGAISGCLDPGGFPIDIPK
jgi:hypothetical protein